MRLLASFVISLIAALISLSVLLFGCARPVSGESPDTVTLAAGRRLCAALYDGRSAELWHQLVPKLQWLFGDSDGLDHAGSDMRAQLGEEQQLVGEEVVHEADARIYVRHARFSRAGAVDIEFALDADSRVIGMALQQQTSVQQ
jgi:hypothetical protein